MNTYIPKDMTLTLFPNAKRPGFQDPDYTGTGKIHGKTFRASAWLNTTKTKDRPYISVRFAEITPVQEQLNLENLQQPAA
jgi:predicted dienelactone hydrolase